MKTTTKIISLTSIFLIAGLIGFFVFFYASKVSNFLEFITETMKEEEDLILNFSKMHIAVYILSAMLLFFAILTFLFNNFYDAKIKKTLQTVFLYINLIILLTIVVLMLICYLKKYELYDFYSLNYTITEEAQFEFMFFAELFLLLFFQGVGNVVLSAISMKYTKEEKTVETTDSKEENVSEKSLLEKEIIKLKESIEVEELKKEYKSLYKKLQNSTKEDEKNS